MNRRNALSLLGVAGFSTTANLGNTSPEHIADLAKRWRVTRDYSLAVMESMPAEEFNFRPVEDQMTFGEQFTHVGFWSTFLLGTLAGKPPIAEPEEKDIDSARTYFIQAYDHCAELIESLSEDDLAKRGIRPNPDWPEHTGEELIIRAYMHTAHHRGQAISYLRLKGIMPPPFTF